MEQDFNEILRQAKALKQQLENRMLMAESALTKIEDSDMQQFLRTALSEAKAGNLTAEEFIESYKRKEAQCQK